MKTESIPRNKYDWQGGVVLFDPQTKVFYLLGFGNGTNGDDLCEGCDDYLYLEYGRLVRDTIEVDDGGELDFNRRKSNYAGDIRNALKDALDFLGVEQEAQERLVYISSYD